MCVRSSYLFDLAYSPQASGEWLKPRTVISR